MKTKTLMAAVELARATFPLESDRIKKFDTPDSGFQLYIPDEGIRPDLMHHVALWQLCFGVTAHVMAADDHMLVEVMFPGDLEDFGSIPTHMEVCEEEQILRDRLAGLGIFAPFHDRLLTAYNDLRAGKYPEHTDEGGMFVEPGFILDELGRTEVSGLIHRETLPDGRHAAFMLMLDCRETGYHEK